MIKLGGQVLRRKSKLRERETAVQQSGFSMGIL